MNTAVIAILGAIGAVAVPVGTYLAVVRRTSGKIETTEASKLWEEAGKMREEYRREADNQRALILELRERNNALTLELDDARTENRKLRREVGQ